MDFQVLGPVSARGGAGAVPIGGSRQQRILAVLLHEAGQVVPVSRMIEAVWRVRPATVRSQVQIGVSRLRSVIREAGGGAAIRAEAAGYLFDLGDGCLDSAAFHRDVAAARALADCGRVGEAADHLHGALGMWHGPALAGVRDRPVLRAWADALDEARIAVLDLCFRADLCAGRHGAVLGDLIDAAESTAPRVPPGTP
ncbi:AfsR/SARP family transcriptional regulator [Streptomyces sp. CA-111067]|uniref:AfsR/SARP family transcriptional regulator n=1 Tax=Streptomyces sp. CA-111067 TaxID=3240046 RepID=UPI003D99602D